MKIALIIGIFLCYQESMAQGAGIIRNAEQNLRWFDSLAMQPLDKQANMIAERLVVDTCMIFPKSRPILSVTDLKRYQIEDSIKNIGKVKGWHAPLVIVDNLTLNPSFSMPSAAQINEWYGRLKQDRFKKISVLLPGPQTTALYGTRGAIGVIFMESK